MENPDIQSWKEQIEKDISENLVFVYAKGEKNMRRSISKAIFMAVALLASSSGVASAQKKLDRTVLPIQEPERPTFSELDVRNVEAPPRFEVKAPGTTG